MEFRSFILISSTPSKRHNFASLEPVYLQASANLCSASASGGYIELQGAVVMEALFTETTAPTAAAEIASDAHKTPKLLIVKISYVNRFSSA